LLRCIPHTLIRRSAQLRPLLKRSSVAALRRASSPQFPSPASCRDRHQHFLLARRRLRGFLAALAAFAGGPPLDRRSDAGHPSG
jgi:hypothetical protein